VNKRAQPQWMAAGIVEAPVAKVWEVLIEINPLLSEAEKQAIVRQDAPLHTTSAVGKLEIDKQHHHIVLEGAWWYRGMHSVEPDARGSRVVYGIYNIAPGIGWWMAQRVQGPQAARDMGKQLHDLLLTIGSRLDCKAYLLAPSSLRTSP